MNPNPAFHLEPAGGLITITAAYTPSTHTHEPDSTYSRFFIVPTVGPTAWLAWGNLTLWLPADDNDELTIDFNEFAHGLGTAPGRLHKALHRLSQFHLAHTLPEQPNTIHVRRRAATLTKGQLARLVERCPTLAACHDQHQHAA